MSRPAMRSLSMVRSPARPTVINRGIWAQFFQRHLCHAIAQTGDYYANKLGAPDQAQALDHDVDQAYSGLNLYPYLQLVQHSMRPSPALSETALASFLAHSRMGTRLPVYPPHAA